MSVFVCAAREGRVLWPQCKTTDNFFSRFIGLLKHKCLSDGEALLIKPCNSVHTVGMRFPIDVIYLNTDMRVIKIVKSVPAWRFSYCKGAASVLEVSANSTHKKGLKEGDYIVLS